MSNLEQELEQAKLRIKQLEDEKRDTSSRLIKESKKANELLNVIIPLGIALSSEKNLNRLLEKILVGAQGICHADAGTIYIKEGNELYFKIIHNSSLNIKWNDEKVSQEGFKPILIFDENSNEYNKNNIATLAAYEATTVNIPNAYENTQFDFSGTKKFDSENNYHSTSFLTVPLKNYHNEVIGVLQLINAQNPATGEIIAFDEEKQMFVESLSSLAATAIDNQMLLNSQKELLDSFIRLISDAIDKKSPYTGGHCKRVPELTEMLVKAAVKQKEGPFSSFSMSEDDLYEVKTAAWLHDIGKITTPEYVVDKATKLETIYDRIETVKLKLLNKKKDIQLSGKGPEDPECLKTKADLEYLEKANVGGEFLSDEDADKIKEIGSGTYIDFEGNEQKLLTDDEVKNLSISRGTLTDEERKIINDHIVVTIQMLERLPLPKNLKRIVEYAGGHHEKMDGSGYPNGLTKEQMSVPARVMAIADIFEALTASDRPYKKGKTLTEALKIMSFMKKDKHIDEDLYELFMRERLFEDYAKKFLKPEQIDEVDINLFL